VAFPPFIEIIDQESKNNSLAQSNANAYHLRSGQQEKEITMLKTASFAAVHFTVAFTVGYLLTGSVLIGSTMALVEPAVNTVAFFFHEKVWDRVQRRRATPAVAAQAA
jgi:uncharacterized membrane protein